jgi:hypothetical protein
MTMSENLVLGLMGGLQDVNGTITFNSNDVGSGPRSLNMGSPGQHSPFYTNSKELTRDFFMDIGRNTPSCFDSSVPEFVDRFNEPMPILYLRARRGANGVMSDMKNYNALAQNQLYQYDVRQYYSYVADLSTVPPTSGVVVGGRMQEYKVNGQLAGAFWQLCSDSANPRNGIGDPMSGGSGDPLVDGKDKVNFALAYFRNPSLSTGAVTNETGSPRNKDSFILISAGPDRLFGTSDDLTTFGNVVP